MLCCLIIPWVLLTKATTSIKLLSIGSALSAHSSFWKILFSRWKCFLNNLCVTVQSRCLFFLRLQFIVFAISKGRMLLNNGCSVHLICCLSFSVIQFWLFITQLYSYSLYQFNFFCVAVIEFEFSNIHLSFMVKQI